MKYKTLFSSARLFALFACFAPPSWAAPFDYYLKCDIRERDVFPPAGSNESFTRHEKYVVCIIEAVRNSSSIIASENQVIKGHPLTANFPAK